jgi:CBS domain-containing protein
MKTENVGSIPVCESRKSHKLVGIVTDRDLALQVVAEERDATSTLVQDVMTRDPFTCRAQEDIQKAHDCMQSHRVRRIPVVDDTGQLVGIIAQADLATRCDEPERAAETIEEISQPSATRAA